MGTQRGLSWAAVALLVVGLSGVGHGGLFIPLGQLPGGGWGSEANAVSADGTVVVGTAHSAGTGFAQAFRWTQETGMVGLGFLSGDFAAESFGFGVSGDGTIVVGEGFTPMFTGLSSDAFRWTEATGMDPLSRLSAGNTWNAAYGISGDGATIVGYSGLHAARWTGDGSVVGPLPPGVEGVAVDASGDGSVIVGIGYGPGGSLAFRWSLASGLTWLDALPAPLTRGWAYAVSKDGSTAVGQCSPEVAGPIVFWQGMACLWQDGDPPVPLGYLPGGLEGSSALGVTADGSMVVGRSTMGVADDPAQYPLNEAFIWTEATGMRSLEDFLTTEWGVDLGGWTLIEARDISPDGRAIVGLGEDPQTGYWRAWLALDDQIPEPATLTLLALGGLGLVSRRRRRS